MGSLFAGARRKSWLAKSSNPRAAPASLDSLKLWGKFDCALRDGISITLNVPYRDAVYS